MASGPITSWQIDGDTMETVTDFIFSGSKVTADGDCSNEIKRQLLLGRKAMTNLDSIFKNRDITLPTKILASNLNTSLQLMGKQWKVRGYILGRSKIIADGDCSHEIKRQLLLGRKAMTNLDSTL